MKNIGEKTHLVSVVTPSYNQGQFIGDTINSVLTQDYCNIEYIIMDACSNDTTQDVVKPYEDRLLFISEKDKGQADAVNKGFRLAKGEILGWLNSDDTYLPGTITKIVDYFTAHPNIVMVYGNAYYIDKSGKITSSYQTEKFDWNRLAEFCFICQPSVFIRKELLSDIGELNIDLMTCMDYDFWIRIGKKYEKRIGFIDDHLATSRMYNENKTLSLREKVYEEIFATVQRHYGRIGINWIAGYVNDVIDGIYLSRHQKYLPFGLRTIAKLSIGLVFALKKGGVRVVPQILNKMRSPNL